MVSITFTAAGGACTHDEWGWLEVSRKDEYCAACQFHLDVHQTLNDDIQATGLDDSEIQVLYNVVW